MKAIAIGLVLATTAWSAPVPRQGAYKVASGGMTATTCPNYDNTPLYKLPYWTIRTVGTSAINLRQSVNPYFSSPAPRFGYFPLQSLGYGTYQGTGFITNVVHGAFGDCAMKSEITAKVNAFGSVDGVLLDATIKDTYLNPSFEAFICQRYGLMECQTTISYDLEYTGDNGGA